MNTDAIGLDRLHDIVVPAPVPWWPPAPGWYWVAACIVVVFLAALIKGFIRWQRNCYRREALAELARQEAALRHPELRATALLAVSEVLKRTALSAFPREQVATLTGPEWFEFLDRTWNGRTFSNGIGATMSDALYDPRTAGALDQRELDDLTRAIRGWIKDHKTDIEQKEAKTTKTPPEGKPLVSSLPSAERSC
jgi:hypothetical protein